MNELKPLADRVVVEPMDAQKQTEGGIYIPDTAQEQQSKGTIIAVGKGIPENPMELKAGDIVIYAKFVGTDIMVDKKKYIVMRQSDVLIVIKSSEK